MLAGVGEGAAGAWAALDAPWQECFELAWRSFREGGVAVGAVVTDPGGGVLSRGRNQRFAAQADAAVTGLLGHAELNALITGLPPQKARQRDAILYTTLQPCPLCLGAVVIARLGRLRFAATDPTWAGVERLPELNPEVLARWPVVEGPLLGPVGVWAAILPVLNTFRLAAARAGSFVSQPGCPSEPGRVGTCDGMAPQHRAGSA